MADPGKDKKRNKIKREHRKLRFKPQQNNNKITSYLPFFYYKQDRTKMKCKYNTHTQTYGLRRRMVDPGKDKKRKKIKRKHKKLTFGPQQNNNKITSYPSLLLLQTRPNKNEMQI